VHVIDFGLESEGLAADAQQRWTKWLEGTIPVPCGQQAYTRVHDAGISLLTAHVEAISIVNLERRLPARDWLFVALFADDSLVTLRKDAAARYAKPADGIQLEQEHHGGTREPYG